MVCPTCNLDNDPSVAVCARCNTTLQTAPAPTYRPAPAPPFAPSAPSRLPLIAGALVLLALIIAGALIYRSTSTPAEAPPPAAAPPPPTVDAATTEPWTEEPPPTDADQALRTQASTIDALLDRSFASRTKLNNAIQSIGNCTDLSQAVADMRTVGDERRTQITELSGLDLTALPNGDTLRTLLTEALQHSLDADQAYVSWAAPTVTDGCTQTPARRTARAQGQAESTKAGTAKEAFLSEWTPVAADLGLPTRTRQSI